MGPEEEVTNESSMCGNVTRGTLCPALLPVKGTPALTQRHERGKEKESDREGDLARETGLRVKHLHQDVRKGGKEGRKC